MKLEDIMEMVEKDLKIDQTNLAKESLETPNIYVRYLNIRSRESLLLKKLQIQFKETFNSKREYYLGRSDPEVYKARPFDKKVMKSEVEFYLESDTELGDLTIKIEVQQEKIFYLDSVLKQIANRGFLIKNAIDFSKLMNGGY